MLIDKIFRYNPISMDSFDTQVYTCFYDSSSNQLADDPALAHKLSVLFMVLAIGSLMNTALPAYNLEAEKYHQLARAALFHTSIFDAPTLHAVQALVSVSRKSFWGKPGNSQVAACNSTS